jgi:hypothetical protein
MSLDFNFDLDLDRVDQIIDIFAEMLQRRSIARELEDLKRFAVEPEQIDALVLAAIQASFCLDDERIAAAPRLDLEPPAAAA